VETRPGGYRWVHDGFCWQYVHFCPEYRRCNRVTHEEGIDYCVEVPAEYETVVETVPVQRMKTVYTPAEYKVRMRQEVFVPGHWEWQATPACGCTPDPRRLQRHLVERNCAPDCPKPGKPMVCSGCARTN
jgi:hypothetical protein